jgi:hypothetical protein
VTGPPGAITGGMLLSRDDEPHRIHWLAVAEVARGRGFGAALVRAAIERWPEGDIDVVTFTAATPGGEAARRCTNGAAWNRPGPRSQPLMVPSGTATSCAGSRSRGRCDRHIAPEGSRRSGWCSRRDCHGDVQRRILLQPKMLTGILGSLDEHS